MEQTSLRPLFDESARQGALLGVALSTISVCMLLSMRFDLLAVVFPLLCLGIPVLLVFTLRSVAAVNTAYLRFSALWMSGIIQFICGGLICCVVTIITLLCLGGGYLGEYIVKVFEQATGQTGLTLDGVMVPSDYDYAVSLFWLIASSGSLLSLVYALILPRVKGFSRSVAGQRHSFTRRRDY